MAEVNTSSVSVIEDVRATASILKHCIFGDFTKIPQWKRATSVLDQTLSDDPPVGTWLYSLDLHKHIHLFDVRFVCLVLVCSVFCLALRAVVGSGRRGRV